MPIVKLNILPLLKKINLVKAIFSRIYLRILSRDLDIPKWHLNATYYVREYKHKVINICNAFNKDVEYIIELGCGSGELISRVNINKKIGIDIDRDVLILCNRLHPYLETFYLNIMEDYDSFVQKINNIDSDQNIMIVMINWLHIYSNQEINNLIDNLLSLEKKILIVVDIYSRIELSKIKDNKTKHNFSKLINVKWNKKFKQIDQVRDIEVLSNFSPKNYQK